MLIIVCTHSATVEQLAHKISGATLHFTGFLLAGCEKNNNKKKRRHSSFLTMSSKPDSSALKQIPEGGLPWLQSHPAGSAMCQTFCNSPSGETKKTRMAETCQRRSILLLQRKGRDLQERRDLLSSARVSHSSRPADVRNLPPRP